MMLGIVIRRLYRRFLVGRRWYRLNLLLHELSLHGIGILNYEDESHSGESALLAVVLDASRPGTTRSDVVLDIGANVGDYASKVKQLNPDARVFAFEPHPVTFQRTIAAGAAASFEAINAGCGDTVGRFKLYDYAGTSTGSQHASLYQNVIEDLHRSEAVAFEVDLTTVDAFLDAREIQSVRLLKIDTEGHEAGVLRGAAGAIADGRIDFIQFEFNAMNVASRTFFKDLVELLPGYQLMRLLPDGPVPLPYDPIRCEIFAFQNIVAVRADLAHVLGAAPARPRDNASGRGLADVPAN